MLKFFGLSFKRDSDSKNLKSFTEPVHDDGAAVVSSTVYGTYIDLEGTVKDEGQLVTRYRTLARQPEIDKAVNEIVNEAIIIEDGEKIVDIILDDIPLNENIKRLVVQEFETILDILNFQNQGHDLFRRWYIDGRWNAHVIVDEDNLMEGIKELRYIDPRKIRKIREVSKERDPETAITLTIDKDEYYIYNENGILQAQGFTSGTETQGVKISKDSIIQCVSGLMDEKNQLVLSYLHSALRPMNQLRSIEDSTLIYHLARAPERRIFYVDTGSMPHHRAAQYIQELQNSMKTKLSYNPLNGEVKDQSRTISMLEDYWFQVREGGRGTKVDTMPAGTQLSQLLETVELFEDKLYASLQVPVSRLKPESTYSIGRSTEINRDELNFAKFIDRIRNKFSVFFVDALEKQLVLKNIITPDEYALIRNKIKFKYQKDNLFAELKDIEINLERCQLTQSLFPIIGKIKSWDWVSRVVWRMTDDEISEQMEKISVEATMPQFMPPEGEME